LEELLHVLGNSCDKVKFFPKKSNNFIRRHQAVAELAFPDIVEKKLPCQCK
jgi:hypothetical protein